MTDAPVIAVNIIDVAPERQQELVELIREGSEEVFGPLPGFQSSTLFVSQDGTRVVNIAHWESMDAVKAVQGNPEAAAFGPRVAALGTYTVGLYRKVYTYGRES
jgi:heme-degrading monooxygenase HmoA